MIYVHFDHAGTGNHTPLSWSLTQIFMEFGSALHLLLREISKPVLLLCVEIRGTD